MSDMAAVGAGAATVRHGEVRYHAALVKLMQATQHNASQGNPVTVVTEAAASAADNNLGKIVDMKT